MGEAKAKKEKEEKEKKEAEEKAKKEAEEKKKKEEEKEQKEKEEKEKKSKLEQEKQKKLSLPKSQPPTTASKPSDSAKTPRIPGRRPLPTPSSAPPIKGYFAPATIKLESKLKDAVREFVNDAVLERVTELEERNAELEEELRFLRNNNNNRPLSSSSTKLSRVDDSENARLRKQVASFKNQLDKIEIELDGIRPGRKSTNLSAGEKKTVEAVSMKLNQTRRQHPKLLEYAENVAESAQQNANDIKEKMSKHIDQVLTRVQKVNPLLTAINS